MPRVAVAAVLVASGLVNAPRPAWADDATRLFEQGRAFVEAGEIDEGCASFEASQKIRAAIGTKLNLADCRERQGHLVIAHALYKEAATEADQAGKAGRATFARERVAALEPKLVHVQIRIAHPELAGLAIMLQTPTERRELSRTTWSEPQLSEPGTITLEAVAPHHASVHRTLDAKLGAPVVFEVPALLEDAVLPPPPPPPHRRTRALALIGLGGTQLVVGLILALHASSEYKDAIAHPTSETRDRIDSARTQANLATVLTVLGIGAATTGVVLYLRTGSTTIAPYSPDRTAVGLVVRGRF